MGAEKTKSKQQTLKLVNYDITEIDTKIWHQFLIKRYMHGNELNEPQALLALSQLTYHCI